jgi:hypothetical protein
MSASLGIRYRFDLPDGSRTQFDFQFDAVTFRLTNPPPAAPPFWTELEFSQCANCPLNASDTKHCPPALHMADATRRLAGLVSFDTVSVTVEQGERTIRAVTSAQAALSSVLGLIMATTACPWTQLLRPMARFHLPFADATETLYRIVTMYLLAREFQGGVPESGFGSLAEIYENLHVVNRGMARRLGAATRTDPAQNAMALLDSYTALLPVAIEDSLEELRPLFEGWNPRPADTI